MNNKIIVDEHDINDCECTTYDEAFNQLFIDLNDPHPARQGKYTTVTKCNIAKAIEFYERYNEILLKVK